MKDKVAVITGGAKGIGRMVALTYARQGAKIVIADIDDDRLDRTTGEVLDQGTSALAVQTDVRSEADVKQLIERAESHFGGLDVLVNDAGIVPHFNWGVPRWPSIRDMDEAFWERVLRTNLHGTFLATKHAIPAMEKRGGGHIITLHGGGGGTGAAPYVVSKDAIRTFSRFVAEEVRPANICVICVSPHGAVATEDAPEEARSRLPGPDTLAPLFLAAAQAGMELSGHTLQLHDGEARPID
ncbi:MAG TPA: SDR family oxidoreductase [Chloroflexota bacterium]|nr:SDR family oxidoreductase [Chloroflexota bacterium]